MKHKPAFIVPAIFIMLLMLITCSRARAGDIPCGRTYGGPDSDWIQDIAVTGDGLIYAVGYSVTPEGKPAYVVKLDAHGNEIWSHTYKRTIARAVVPTGDGGAVIAGQRLLRLDKNGAVVWEYEYGDRGMELRSVLGTDDRGFVAAGPEGIVKVDDTGNLIWKYEARHTYCCALAHTPEGHIMAATTGGHTLYLWEINAQGEPVLEKQYEQYYVIPAASIRRNIDGAELENYSFSFGIAHALAPLTTGGFVAAGEMGQVDDRLGHMLAQYYAVGFNGDGELLWGAHYGGPGKDEAYAAAASPGGGFAVVGTAKSNAALQDDFYSQLLASVESDEEGEDGIDISEFEENFQDEEGNPLPLDAQEALVSMGRALMSPGDILVVRADARGNILWERRFGGTGHEDARGIAAAPHGGFYVAASTESYGNGDMDFWVFKVSPDGMCDKNF